MKDGSLAIAVCVAAFLALLGAAMGEDVLFRTHAWIAFTVLSLGAILLFRQVKFAPVGLASGDAASMQATYMDGVVRYGVFATMFWGTAGMLVGVIVASQLALPDLNFGPI